LEEVKRVGKIIKKEGRLHYGDLDFTKKDGTGITLGISYDLLRDNEGRIIGIVAVGKDVTEKKKMERELIQTKDSLESLIEGIIDPIATTDKRGIVTFINKGMTDLLGYEKEDIIGKHISMAYHGGMEEAKKLTRLLILRERGSVRNYETQFIKKDGGLLPAIVSMSLLRDKSGEVIGTLGICKDMAERKRLEDELRSTKSFLESILESSPNSIVVTDEKGRITYLNRYSERLAGFSREERIGTPSMKYYAGGPEVAGKLRRLLREKGEVQNYEAEFIKKGGGTLLASVSASLMKDQDGKVIGTLGITQDISEKKRLEKELEKLSITDSLTGIYNQRHFYNELKREVERAKRLNHPLSLLLFDIDEFKYYNDTYGHLEGDKVLHEVGKIVVKSIRVNVDSGYRYGGDEFVVILPEAGREQAFSVADRIRVSFNNAGLVDVTLSMGLIEYRIEYDLETFVRHADKAMYTAKRLGGDRIIVHE
jgi:diguanylate cyclase (GGDEF)-like protein/PAS domain S-box-containing protein